MLIDRYVHTEVVPQLMQEEDESWFFEEEEEDQGLLLW